MTVALLGDALVFSFVLCCLLSALLQILAWSRHAKAGGPVSIRAFWSPEAHFDEIGIHQIRLARRLLLIGGGAYLAYGALMVGTG